MADTLVLVATAADGQRLSAQWPVVATLPPRLLVLRLPGAAPLTGTVPLDQAQPPLTESEQLFAAAWAAQGHKSAPRPGDAADWDAPDFTPP